MIIKPLLMLQEQKYETKQFKLGSKEFKISKNLDSDDEEKLTSEFKYFYILYDMLKAKIHVQNLAYCRYLQI